MTKAALIEQLAEIVRDGHFEGQPSLSWSLIPESTREEYREDARKMWPLIVAFVATFITERCRGEIGPVECAQTWREEMSS